LYLLLCYPSLAGLFFYLRGEAPFSVVQAFQALFCYHRLSACFVLQGFALLLSMPFRLGCFISDCKSEIKQPGLKSGSKVPTIFHPEGVRYLFVLNVYDTAGQFHPNYYL
jgi:hypothetical protein